MRAREEAGWELESRERGAREGGEEEGVVGVRSGAAGCGEGGKSRLSKSGPGPGSAWLLTWAVEGGERSSRKEEACGVRGGGSWKQMTSQQVREKGARGRQPEEWDVLH